MGLAGISALVSGQGHRLLLTETAPGSGSYGNWLGALGPVGRSPSCAAASAWRPPCSGLGWSPQVCNFLRCAVGHWDGGFAVFWWRPSSSWTRVAHVEFRCGNRPRDGMGRRPRGGCCRPVVDPMEPVHLGTIGVGDGPCGRLYHLGRPPARCVGILEDFFARDEAPWEEGRKSKWRSPTPVPATRPLVNWRRKRKRLGRGRGGARTNSSGIPRSRA